jgi:thiol-disulfide isomerase/thioredoxin
MTTDLRAKLARQLSELVRRVGGARAIHPPGMPSLRSSTQLLFSIVLLGQLLAISGCRKRANVPEGDLLPSLALPTADDRAFDPAALRGKPTLVMFASPTCGYCAAELPIAQRAAAAEQANLVAVYIVGGKQHAASVTKSAGFTAPVLVDETGALRKKYDIKGVPYMLVLGPDGHAHDALRGQQDEAALREAIDDAR